MKKTSDRRFAAGNFRPGRVRTAPNFRRGAPAMPRGLPLDAQRVWRRVTPLLAQAGVLTTVDVDVLAAYALMTARLHKRQGFSCASDWARWQSLAETLLLTPRARRHVALLDKEVADDGGWWDDEPQPGSKNVVNISELLKGFPEKPRT
jgi:phage terminase small subunit